RTLRVGVTGRRGPRRPSQRAQLAKKDISLILYAERQRDNNGDPPRSRTQVAVPGQRHSLENRAWGLHTLGMQSAKRVGIWSENRNFFSAARARGGPARRGRRNF